MKIGILSDWLGLGFEGGVRKAAEMGADGVQLYAVEGELAPENMSAEKRAWARQVVADAGIEISAICGDLGDGGFAFAERNPEKIARTKEIVDLAVDLGCRIITTHIGVVPSDANHPRFAVIAEALKALGAYAESKGATFAIETGPETSEDLLRMLEYVDSPGIGVNLDPANLVMCHESESGAHAAEVLGKYIVHTHAKDGVLFKSCDNDIMYGMVPAPEGFDEWDYCAEVPLGQGRVDFPSYIEALKKVGYDGYLTIEREVNDPVKDIAMAVDFLQQVLRIDDYSTGYMNQVEVVPMPEAWKAVQGQRVTHDGIIGAYAQGGAGVSDAGMKPIGRDEVTLRAVRNSWAQLNLAVTCPTYTTLLLEERPSFGHHYPLEMENVLRASMDIPGLKGELKLVEMVKDDDGVGKADPVVDSGSAHIRPWNTHQLVAMIDVPKEAKPGLYEGTIRFYAHNMLYDERLAQQVKVRVRVEEVTLPDAKDGKFYLNLWQHVFNIARKAEVRAYTPEHIEALRPYAKALGELGNKAATVLCSDAAWAGQGCTREYHQPSDLYEYNFIRVRKDRDGKFHYDFSFAEAYIQLMEEYGATDVMLAGLYGIWNHPDLGFKNIVDGWADAIRVTYIDEKDGALRFMRTAEEIENYFAAIHHWIVETGRIENCYLMGDETDLGNTPQEWVNAMAAINRLFPGVHRDWDNGPDSIMSETYKNERIDIYTPQIDLYARASDEMKRAIHDRIQPGGKILWSVCCWPPVMNSFLYTNLNEVRLHGLVTEGVKADGFVRWNFSVWPENPREDLSFFHPGWPAGDTCFVYPGKGGQCFKSLRYYALRRGIEDFELCQMVKERVANADEVIGKALACVCRETDIAKWDLTDYYGREKYMSLDTADYEAARNILIDALLKENQK